jgi:hypothetical protein
LRLKTLDVPAAHLLITDGAVNDSELPTIKEALEVYLKVIGIGRYKLFFATANVISAISLSALEIDQ